MKKRGREPSWLRLAVLTVAIAAVLLVASGLRVAQHAPARKPPVLSVTWRTCRFSADARRFTRSTALSHGSRRPKFWSCTARRSRLSFSPAPPAKHRPYLYSVYWLPLMKRLDGYLPALSEPM